MGGAFPGPAKLPEGAERGSRLRAAKDTKGRFGVGSGNENRLANAISELPTVFLENRKTSCGRWRSRVEWLPLAQAVTD